ncbi:hypothetical protein ABHI18_005228 [Aspergillus niger]
MGSSQTISSLCSQHKGRNGGSRLGEKLVVPRVVNAGRNVAKSSLNALTVNGSALNAEGRNPYSFIKATRRHTDPHQQYLSFAPAR